MVTGNSVTGGVAEEGAGACVDGDTVGSEVAGAADGDPAKTNESSDGGGAGDGAEGAEGEDGGDGGKLGGGKPLGA